jgi:hypothetical protein
MSMISAESAIHRFRRDLTVSTLLKTVLVAVALLAIVVGPFVGGAFDGSLVLIVVGAVWLVLSYRSVRGSRMAADSPSLIASGQFEVAEQHIVDSLHSFSLFRTVKLLSLHHLALLRHAQQRWQETAMLCRALLRHRLGPASGLGKSTHLILADSLLEMGDVRGAYDSLAGLYQQRLTLGEALNLLGVQVDYMCRIAAWDAMLDQLPTRAQLAELMSTTRSAQTQALLALAAKKTGRGEWEQYLRRRAELLVEPAELVHRRPVLAELWPTVA